MSIERNKREIEFIYNKEEASQRKLLPYLDSIHYKVKTIDISHEQLTETQLALVCNELKNGMYDLVNQKISPFDEKSPDDFNHEDLLTILKKNPSLINTPIAIASETVKTITGTKDVINMERAFDSHDQ